MSSQEQRAARALQQDYPGMPYTKALRLVRKAEELYQAGKEPDRVTALHIVLSDAGVTA